MIKTHNLKRASKKPHSARDEAGSHPGRYSWRFSFFYGSLTLFQRIMKVFLLGFCFGILPTGMIQRVYDLLGLDKI